MCLIVRKIRYLNIFRFFFFLFFKTLNEKSSRHKNITWMYKPVLCQQINHLQRTNLFIWNFLLNLSFLIFKNNTTVYIKYYFSANMSWKLETTVGNQPKDDASLKPRISGGFLIIFLKHVTFRYFLSVIDVCDISFDLHLLILLHFKYKLHNIECISV